MVPTKLTAIGAITFALGMLVAGLGISAGAGRTQEAHAQQQCVTPSPVPTADPSVGPGGEQSLGISPTCVTPTAVKRVTRTPTSTTTSTATKTSVPEPTQPPSTAVPATATRPSGGTEGAGVRPPDTGSGPSNSGASPIWAIVLGSVVAIAGGGLVLTGATRRR